MLFIDTSNISEIKKYVDLGIASGITTNQKILQKEGNSDIEKIIKEISKISNNLPINVELTQTSGTDKELINEAVKYFESAVNVVIKVPMWSDGRGLRVAKALWSIGIPVNITCCMSMSQVVLASLVKVDYVSLFYNRMVDYYIQKECSRDEAYDYANDIISCSSNYIFTNNLPTKIIVGSIREPGDVLSAIIHGAHIVTVPPKILEQMFQHPKTDETIVEFDKAWKTLTKQQNHKILYPTHNHLGIEPCTEKCPNFRALQKEKLK